VANVPTPASSDSSPASANASASPEVPAAESGASPVAAAPAGEGAASTDSAADRPSERILIGSQRADEATETLTARPTHPVGDPSSRPPQAPAARKAYPPPNIRDRLSPELQLEFEAAVSGGIAEGSSIDDLLEASAGSQSALEIAPETRLTARVMSIHDDDVFVDLGGRTQGVLPIKQFEETVPEVGAEVEVIVARFNADQGLYDVSLPAAAVDVGNWDEVQEGQVVEVAIVGHNKGGLECQAGGIRGFIPMGQISLYRVESPEEFVGQRLACVVTEANRSRKNLVLSHRALMERERKANREKLLAELAPGQLREGVVRSLQEFGAFVDLGGVDGLIHVSQISWERVGHPSEVLQVGQQVKVRVEKVNQQTGKISLIYRDQADNPWESADQQYAIGATVKGAVSKLMQFGAFVKLGPGVEGLIHISELGHGRVHRVSDVLSEGQEVEVKVLAVDKQAQRISLSLKALMPKPEKPDAKKDELPEGPVPTPKDVPKPTRRGRDKQLKGGLGGPSGGEQFGLKW
jgi:small subunit ribosomal protein S1